MSLNVNVNVNVCQHSSSCPYKTLYINVNVRSAKKPLNIMKAPGLHTQKGSKCQILQKNCRRLYHLILQSQQNIAAHFLIKLL